MRARAKLAGVAVWTTVGVGCTSYVINRYDPGAPADAGTTNADAGSGSDAPLLDGTLDGSVDGALPESGPNDASVGSG
jgi:hypothetical protein